MGAHFHIPARLQNPALTAAFLASTDVVDWYHADVRTLAWYLAGGENDAVEVARRCFEWVRDEIRHSVDFGDTVVTCAASEVLAHRTGFCYAKSHLLAALCARMASRPGFAINGSRSTARVRHFVCTASTRCCCRRTAGIGWMRAATSRRRRSRSSRR